ncbi:MAG: hypothetical protein U0168_30100 [Nannocystaceae bacterium]
MRCWVGGVLVLAACGPAVAGGSASGSGSDGSGSTAGDADGTATSASATVADASGSGSSAGGSDPSGADDSSSGAPQSSWCLERADIEDFAQLPDEAVATADPAIGHARLWQLDANWDPFDESLTTSLTPYDVATDGSTVPGDTLDVPAWVELFADIDGDGIDDVVLRDVGGAQLSWLALGDGGAGSPQPLAVPMQENARWLDGDGDGRVDRFVFAPDPGGLTLERGDGSGGFAPFVDFGTPMGPQAPIASAVIVVDAGVLALEFAEPWHDFGYGNGSTTATIDGPGAFALGPATPIAMHLLVAAADFDGDARVELVLGEESSALVVWSDDGAGGLVSTPIGDANDHAVVVHLGDVPTPQLLTITFDGIVRRFESPTLGLGSGVEVGGTLPMARVPQVIDVDGDGQDELLLPGYEDERWHYQLARFVPCE